MCVRLTMLIGTAPKHGHACFLHAREHHAEDKINTECTSHQCDPKRVCQVTDLKIHCMSLIAAAAAAVLTIVVVRCCFTVVVGFAFVVTFIFFHSHVVEAQ